jgi:hypothetical protein
LQPSNLQTYQHAFTYLLYFLLLPHSFALTKNATLLFSILSALFVKNTGGWGTPSLPTRNKMKLQTAKSAVLSIRCIYLSPTGRRCRRSVSDAHSGLCPQHRAEQAQVEAADHYNHLTANFQFFQTAQGINFSLMNLYQLLAQNRISPRRAAVLSYISSLLLRTLPQIDADRAAGITDPTKPKPINVSAQNSNPIDDSGLNSAGDSVVGSNSESDTLSKAEIQTETGTHLNSANTWDPAIPEPDPTKKPS